MEQSDIDDKSNICYFTGSADTCAFNNPASYDNQLFKTKKDQRQMGDVHLYICAVFDLRIFYDYASIALRGIFRRNTTAE